MLYERRIGDARVFNIVEMVGPTHVPERVWPELTPGQIAANSAWLTPNQYVPAMNRFIVGIQIWIAHIGDAIVVIDTGVGNAKPRGLPRFNMLNTLVPLWLEAAGAAPDKVTHVINTHLHGDHVGWNTQMIDGAQRPYFPNARYFMPESDFAYFKTAYEAAKGIGETEAIGDSVLPLIDADLVEFYGEGFEPVPRLKAELARGHTPGQFIFRLESAGARGAFCADIFHSPIQIALPDLNTSYCVEQDHARATRHAFLESVAGKNALIMPCHFGFPHCGTVDGDAHSGYRFVPEAR